MYGVLLSVLAIIVTLPARADLLVTKTADSFDGHCDSDCSLREAIQLANETPGPTRIILPMGTYTLSLASERDEFGRIIEEDANATGDLDIRGQLTIVGKGMNKSIVNANRIDRVFHVHPGATVEMDDLTMFLGKHTDHAGTLAIETGAVVLLRRCNVSNGIAGGIYDAAGYAGGISNNGTLTIDGGRFENNHVDHGDRSGPLPSVGGGIYNAGTLVVREVWFSGNGARDRDEGGWGGGLYNAGNALILRSTFDQSRVGWNGNGTAILNAGGATLRLENSTVTAGEIEDGFPVGAVANGQSSDTVPAVMRLVNVTIAANRSHGLLNYGKLDVLNTIIAGNSLAFEGSPPEQNCLNIGPLAVFRQRGLLRGTDDFTNCEADIIVSNETVFTRVMYPLATNNWTIPTFALRRHSPAVDAAIGACPSTDERRVTRPRDGDGDGVAVCDLGAYERPKP